VGNGSDGCFKVGIISANWGVQAHLPAWRTLRDDIEVTAICTAHRETAARNHDIARPFWDYRAMCADPDLNIIDCGTRPSLRYDMVKRVLGHDKHVYDGIPFAMDLGQARDMLSLQRARKKVGVIDAFIQAIPAVLRMKEMIEEGCPGGGYSVTSFFNQQLFNQPSARFPYNWFAEQTFGASARAQSRYPHAAPDRPYVRRGRGGGRAGRHLQQGVAPR
jgi:predicted dehydrogenase